MRSENLQKLKDELTASLPTIETVRFAPHLFSQEFWACFDRGFRVDAYQARIAADSVLLSKLTGRGNVERM